MPPSLSVNLKPKQKVLVYLFGSLGDSLVAIPALRALRRHYPGAEIVLLQNFLNDNLVQASEVIPDELVDRYLSYKSGLGKFAQLLNFYRLWRVLRRERFDAAAYAVLSERPKKSVRRDRVFFRFCGIPELYGFHTFSDNELYPVDADGHPAMTEHEAVRKLRRLAADGIEISLEKDTQTPLLSFSPFELDQIDQWLKQQRQKPDVPLIALAPGCKAPTNAWPIENFIRLGNYLLATETCEIIVVGGTAEYELGEQMIAAWGKGINAAGAFSVRESGALLSRCSFHIGLDTGTTHLAAVAGTRCFVIFGERSNPGLWYPLGKGHAVLYHPVKCAGCRFQDCPIPDHPCMTGITFESAWLNLKAFLDQDPTDAKTRLISV